MEHLKHEQPFPAYDGEEPYVFVSYSHADSSAVFNELTWLNGRGFNIWYDRGIEGGAEWREELGQAILHAGLFLYFVTPDSVQSENCRKELNFAIEENIPVLAVHLEGTELPAGLKLTLSDRQAIFRYELTEQDYQRRLQSSLSVAIPGSIDHPICCCKRKENCTHICCHDWCCFFAWDCCGIGFL